MYLVHLLQNKGYPVQNIYEKELKNVNTIRIQEFLDEKEREHYLQEMGGPELDEKYHFSFHTDDSFEAIDDGPMLCPKRPSFVPPLDLDGLPGYETSSEEQTEQAHSEEQEPEKPEPFHYNESMKYIQNFYDKYHSDAEVNNDEQYSNNFE